MKSVIILFVIILSISRKEPNKEKFNLGFEELGLNGNFAEGRYNRGDYKISIAILENFTVSLFQMKRE